MIITGVTSSPAAHGNTTRLVTEALKGATDQGASVSMIVLAEQKLKFCKGCMSCLQTGYCCLSDSLEDIRSNLLESDGIILGSPTYGLEPNAIMKNFLDRIGLFTAYTSLFAGKYFAGISTAGAVGADKVAKKLTVFANGCFGRGYISGTLGAKIGWDSVTEHPKYIDKAYQLGRDLAYDIKNQKTYPLQNLFPRLINRLIVRKAFTKNILTHKESNMKAVYLNLLQRDLL